MPNTKALAPWRCVLVALAGMSLVPWPAVRAPAQEAEATAKAAAPHPKIEAAPSVEDLVAEVEKSVVVVTVRGRNGQRQNLGTGFVVGADGLIATNLHVIGEARPISVELADGRQFDAISVHATDRRMDLAVIRIDAEGLPALELGRSADLKQGQPVVALGNPQGLRYSVVTGVVSGRREIDGFDMIQLAIPIEPGNSGGPLLDMQGRVHGILTMKSAVTRNLGYAMPVDGLVPMLEKPNPVPMDRWLTIGALDEHQWKPLFGARWRQYAGRLTVEGSGAGFGGRSLCLWQRDVPETPFEMAVTVRLDDESGAAGLVFSADGDQKHFGFYPSAGGLRLTHFGGPDVYSWQVLYNEPNKFYRPGDWNTLKVRVEADQVLCYVNGHLATTSRDPHLVRGQIGLAKFRDTVAEFKNFRVGRKLTDAAVSGEVVARIDRLLQELPAVGDAPLGTVDTLVEEAEANVAGLRNRAQRLEQQAEQMRRLATEVHERHTVAQLAELFERPEDKVDLFHAALLVARIDNEELDVDAYREEIDRMARTVAATIPDDADDATRLAALDKYLFEENGFHGSRSDYYSRENSYINAVLDDREGLPITLSVVYMELARRLDLEVVGISMPGHFVVEFRPKEGEPQLIDVFDSARALSRDEAAELVRSITGGPLLDEHLAAADSRSIVVRMLRNLLELARDDSDAPGMLRYADAILAVDPTAAEERWIRAVFRARSGEREAALEDVDWLLEHEPPGMSLEPLEELRRFLISP